MPTNIYISRKYIQKGLSATTAAYKREKKFESSVPLADERTFGVLHHYHGRLFEQWSLTLTLPREMKPSLRYRE